MLLDLYRLIQLRKEIGELTTRSIIDARRNALEDSPSANVDRRVDVLLMRRRANPREERGSCSSFEPYQLPLPT